jgi:hypothetical protein
MIQKSYNEFILEKIEDQIIYLIEESVFIMSDDLYNLMKDISGDGDRQPISDDPVKEIARVFMRLELEDVDSDSSYLDLSDDNQTIKFLIADKADKYRKEKNLTIKQLIADDSIARNSIRVGRLVRKVIDVYNKKFDDDLKFTDADIESFVNKYKAHYDYKSNKMSNFKVLKGTSIADAYFEDNYSNKKGTLGSSCMRYDDCQTYFDLYTQSDSCSLLVLYCPDKKISGRALLWETIDGVKLMDRIYTNNDSDVKLFEKWASDNGYLCKINQTYFGNDKEEREVKATIKTYKIDLNDSSASKYEKFPYLDTFRYYYWNEGVLRNYNTESGYYVLLEDTDGDCLCRRCDEMGEIDCKYCHGYSVIDGEEKCDKCENGVVKCDRCGGFANRYNN